MLPQILPYNFTIQIGTGQKLTSYAKRPHIRGPYKRALLNISLLSLITELRVFLQNIPHTSDAIRAAAHFADFFVERTRRLNGHR